jgi:HEAT repeat protein
MLGQLLKAADPFICSVFMANSLIKDLKDKDSSVRASAAESLGNLNDSKAIDPLIQSFKDENSSVAVNAKNSLVKLGKTSIGPLTNALFNEDCSVRDLAAIALGDLKGGH